jgi:hypothetical protein
LLDSHFFPVLQKIFFYHAYKVRRDVEFEDVMGREMAAGRQFQGRAREYWQRRLESAVKSADPEHLRRELGVIGHFFIWEELDLVWLLEQLLIMLRAGFAPADSFGVLDALAKLVPEHIEKVIDATNGLVRRPSVEAWTFAAQEQSLRKILVEGMNTRSEPTVLRLQEIVSFLRFPCRL